MKKKALIIFICLVLIIGISYGIIYLNDLSTYKNITSSLTITNIDISKIKDGVYTGEFDAKLVAAKAKVTVKDGKIAEIQLLNHKTERGKSAEILPDRVVAAQSLDIDVVSGATNSSKVILKAIENALRK